MIKRKTVTKIMLVIWKESWIYFSECTLANFISLLQMNLITVTSLPISNAGLIQVPVLSSLDPYHISFSSFTFPGAPYWIFLLFIPWLPCHFYLVVIEQQQKQLLQMLKMVLWWELYCTLLARFRLNWKMYTFILNVQSVSLCSVKCSNTLYTQLV